MSQKITMLVDTASINRNTIPELGDRAFHTRAAFHDQKFGSTQRADYKVVQTERQATRRPCSSPHASRSSLSRVSQFSPAILSKNWSRGRRRDNVGCRLRLSDRE